MGPETPLSHEAHAKRLAALTVAITEVHALLLAFLARLPIPVTLAPLAAPGDVHPSLALHRAARLAEWQPIAPYTAQLAQEAITQWLIAYDLATLADAGPYPWRLDGIAGALASSRAALIEAYRVRALEDRARRRRKR